MNLQHLLAVLVSCAICCGSEAADPHPQPVIELWYVTPGQAVTQPEIALFADGRVWVKDVAAHRSLQLPSASVGQLVAELLASQSVGQLTTLGLTKQVQTAALSAGLSYQIPNAANSVIRIRSGANLHEVQCHAAALMATRFPEVPGLHQFVTAQRKLENVRAVVLLGGAETATELATQASQSLEQEYGLQIPLTRDHLAMVQPLPNGSCYCQFLVTTEQSSEPVHIVSLFHTPGQPTRVSLLDGGTQLQ